MLAEALQFAQLVGFITLLFVLYRLLSSTQQATIQMLKERLDYTEAKLKDAESQRPDALARSLKDRVDGYEDELKRLVADKESYQRSTAQIYDLMTKEADRVAGELAELTRQIRRAHELTGDFLCPNCEAPMLSREEEGYSIPDPYDDFVSWENLEYECGRRISNGEEVAPCKREPPQTRISLPPKPPVESL